MDRLSELNLLFLEDNEEFAKNTIAFLNIYFKKIFHSTSIKGALKIYSEKRIDIIFSDIKVNDGNGLDFIKKIRLFDKEIPIAILSAYKDEDFLFKAIPLNITAYELKPLSYDKFLGLLNTISSTFKEYKNTFVHKNLTYSFKTKILLVNNKEITLTKKEIDFIELLIKSSEEIVTNEMIQRDVYEEKVMSDSALKNLLLRLRKKLGAECITTVVGVGYKLS